jgi:hypothetical protein
MSVFAYRPLALDLRHVRSAVICEERGAIVQGSQRDPKNTLGSGVWHCWGRGGATISSPGPVGPWTEGRSLTEGWIVDGRTGRRCLAGPDVRARPVAFGVSSSSTSRRLATVVFE